MGMRFISAFVLTASLAAAQSGLTPPRIGFVRDSANRLRALLGISGNFWMGGTVARGVIDAASSGRASILQTRRGLIVVDTAGDPLSRPFPASGEALFAFSDDGSPALVWLRESGRLLRWTRRGFIAVPAADPGGSVVSIAAPRASSAAFLVERDREVWRVDISLGDGALLFAAKLPGVSSPALLLDDGTLLFARNSSLVLRNPEGDERTIAFDNVAIRFAPVGRDWILIDTTTTTHLVLRLSTGALFELPESTQEARR